MKYEAGKYYEVPCAEIRMKEDRRSYHIPVLDHPHSDPAFGFPHEHYHIDGRFELEPRMRQLFQLQNGCTNHTLMTKASKLYEFRSISQQSVLCTGNYTGLIIQEKPGAPIPANYAAWYQTFIGKTCIGKACPHLGTAMTEENGRLVCPMHGLIADSLTGEIIERVQFA